MSTHFRELFTVAVKHSYYADACTDFEFVTPPSTASALRGGRLLARMLAGRLHVLFAAHGLGAPINSLAGRTLTFGLRLVNPWFGNFTEPVLDDAALLPFYANRGDAEALEPRGVILASGVHTHAPRTDARPLNLRLSDSAGAVVATQTLNPDVAVGSFDLRALPDGVYKIDEDPGGGSIAPAQLYLSAELRNAGVWGILALKIEAGFYEAPAEFSLKFAARQAQLKYFVVASDAADVALLNVSDSRSDVERQTEVRFDKVLPDSFSESDISPSLLGDDPSRIVMFRSETAVAWRERGLRKIQLQRNGDVLVEHLPQPGADRSQAQFIIHLSKP